MAILRKGGLLGVCVHHSVYKQAHNLTELKAQASLFNTWHKKKSWAETTKTPSAYPYISYHYLMATDGSILKVTDEKYVKYHAGDNFRGDLSFNLHGIAICLTGNYENDKPTDAQMRSLVEFIRDVEKRHKINARIRGHKETSESPTACPGKNIGTSKSGWLKQVIANVNDSNYPPEDSSSDCSEQESEILELKKGIKTLEEKIGGLELKLEACSKEKADIKGNLESVKGDLEETKKELKLSEDKYATLMIEKKTLANTNADLVQELNELKAEKENFIKKLIDKIFEWLRGFTK
jgi:hypothetical protein